MGFGKGKLTTIHDRVNFYKDVYDDSGVHFEREGNKVSLVTGKGIVFIDKLTVYSEDAFNHAFDTYKPRQDCLNSNQQIVLEWLKSDDHPNYSNIFDIFSDLLDYQVPVEVGEAFTEMMTDSAQQFQVLRAFAEWGMKE